MGNHWPLMSSFKVLYDYVAQSAKEIDLTKDDIITVLKIDESGWAEGTSKGKTGWFPKDYAVPFDNTINPNVSQLRKKEKKGGVGKRMSTRFFKKDKTANTGDADEEEYDFSILGNKGKTTTYLSKWISNRNTKLKEKGLIDDTYNAPGSSANQQDTIYGVELKEVLEKYGGPVPPIIRQCKDILQKTAMKEVGIFRLSGVASQVNQLGVDFNTVGAKPDLSIDCNAVAGALKKFFRELPEPLFTFEAHDMFLEATREANKVDALKAALATLPRENYLIIHYLMKFLKEISQYADENKMAASNLGIVFGPTLMRNKEESLSGMMNPLNNPSGTIAALIENFESIFGDYPEELEAMESAPEPSAATETVDNLSSKNINRIKAPGGANLLTRGYSMEQVGRTPGPTSPFGSRDTSPTSRLAGNAPRRGSPTPPGNRQRRSTNTGELSSSQEARPRSATSTKTPAGAKPPPIAPKPTLPPKPAVIPTAAPKEEEKPPIPPKPTIPPKPSLDSLAPVTANPTPTQPAASVPANASAAPAIASANLVSQIKAAQQNNAPRSASPVRQSSPVARAPPAKQTPPPKPGPPSRPGPPSKPKEFAHTLYDFIGDPSLGQMSFTAGQQIEIIKKHQSGWWTGSLNGVKGLFPMNFVTVKVESESLSEY